jgi:transmembrane sensor
MPGERIAYLIERVLQGSADQAEREELAEWAAAAGQHRGDTGALEAAWQRFTPQDHLPDDKAADILAAILATPKQRAVPRIGQRWIRVAAAAAVFLVIAGAGWLWSNRPAGADAVNRPGALAKDDRPPGGDKAVLTLGNGSQIILDSAHNGLLAHQGNATVVKTNSGQIAYESGKTQAAQVFYNVLATPRGGEYQLTLPDGTRVWLNAASSIRYPTAFVGAERRVEVTGEAYFEVRTNASQPFKVMAGGREEVEVLGTSFDINAYDDENSLKTTLLEGSVRVAARTSPPIVGVNTNNNKLSVVLKPGQQAGLVVGENTNNRGRGLTVDYKADVEEAIAWKNGRFAFTHADLPTVMRQLSRWYNVDVHYDGSIPKDEFDFSGKIGMTLTLDQVLKVLTKTKVHYRIEGNQLTIER